MVEPISMFATGYVVGKVLGGLFGGHEVTHTRLPEGITCAAGKHRHHKDLPACPACELDGIRAEADAERARWATCGKKHRYLAEHASCPVCKSGDDRLKAEIRARRERQEFQMKVSADLAANEAMINDMRNAHLVKMAQISADDVEAREKLEKEHRREVLEKRLSALVMKWNGLINDFDSHALLAMPLKPRLRELVDQLREEVTHKEKWKGIGLDESILRLVFFSPTGHGKSTLANRILGDDSEDADSILKVGHLAQACTQEIVHRVVEWPPAERDASIPAAASIPRVKICVIDTPGWDESESADRRHANNLISYLRGAQFVQGIAIVKNQSTRFRQGDVQMFKRLEAMIGEDLWTHVFFVVTHVEGRGGRPADGRKYREWLASFLEEMDFHFDLTKKLKKSRKTVRDMRVIGLSSFDESGGEFDYRHGIDKMVDELKRMGQWTFDSFVSPFDALKREFDEMAAELIEKEGILEGLWGQMKAIEKEITDEGVFSRDMVAVTCFSSFKPRYQFEGRGFVESVCGFVKDDREEDEKKDD